MHIPDGLLDAKTLLITTTLSAGALGVAVKKTNKTLNNRQVPFMGVMSAFIFAAQMVNFPIIGGTSGHLIGAALAAALFGPYVAGIIISTVLFVQCLVFQDGGITALGANVFNMAVVAVYISYFVNKLLAKLIPNKTGKLIAIFGASWSGVVAASVVAAAELAFSGLLPLKTALVAMVSWHVFIGIGEGLITATVLSYIASINYKNVCELQDAR